MNLYDILMTEDVVTSINNNLDELIKMIPEITCMFDFDQKNPHHHLDVWNHTLYALSLSEPDFEVRVTLLLHDIGKPLTCIESNGIRHFPNHAETSAKMAKKILNRLGYDEEFSERIRHLVRMHDTPITELDMLYNNELTYKRYLVQKCDALAHHPDKLEKREEYLTKTKKLLDN